MTKSSRLSIIQVMLCFFAKEFVYLVCIASHSVNEEHKLSE